MNENRQVVLAHRPEGWPTESDFRLVESPIPQPNDGEVLVRNRFLSLDPYMRMRMSDAPSYAPHVEIGEVMVGGTVGEVIASRSPLYKGGEVVVGTLGWRLYGTVDAKRVRRIAAPMAPLSTYLGVLGMPGVTAWVGFELIGWPESGRTALISAASGAVGSVAGQIARIQGARTVGIAGGAAKCAHVVSDLGLDACVDYKADNLASALRSACPQGIDVCFENVGGPIFDLVLTQLNPFSRIALCGQVSQYNETEPYGMRNLRSLLVNRVKLQGFIVSDHMALWPKALDQLEAWFAAGKLKYRETVTDGLENAPHAFISLLRGDKLGKQLVRLHD